MSDDDNKPSWLTESNVKTVAKIANNPVAQKAAMAAVDLENPASALQNEGTMDLDVDPDELKRLRNLNYGLRLLNIAVSVVMAYAAVEQLTSSDIGTVFIACYVFFFATLICCFECAMKGVSKTIVQNFGFLYSTIGRTIFLIFVGAMCYDLALAGKVVMGLIALTWLCYIIIRFKHPKYEEYVMKKHYYSLSSGGGSAAASKENKGRFSFF